MTDDEREFVRRVFAPDDAPTDVVDREPGPGITLETLRAQDAAANTWRMVHMPGQVLLDLDGAPIGVEPGEDVPTHVSGPVITEADVARLGIDPADFPNTRIIPTIERN